MKGHTFPCPICREPRDIRLSKTDRPYLVCDGCGVQLFVRGDTGIRRLRSILRDGGADGGKGPVERDPSEAETSGPSGAASDIAERARAAAGATDAGGSDDGGDDGGGGGTAADLLTRSGSK